MPVKVGQLNKPCHVFSSLVLECTVYYSATYLYLAKYLSKLLLKSILHPYPLL